MREAYDFLREAGVWFLATSEGGQPRVRPFDSICLCRDRLYFQTGRFTAVSLELHANPRVELCALRGEEWLRIEGSTVLDDSAEARTSMPMHDGRYEPENTEAEHWYLRNCTAALYDGAELVKTWRF